MGLVSSRQYNNLHGGLHKTAMPAILSAAGKFVGGLGNKAKDFAGSFVPQPIKTRYTNAQNWLQARNLKPVKTLLGPGLIAGFAGNELAKGRSIGDVVGENLGFFGAMGAVNALAKKLPNFRGKGALSMIGGMGAGMVAAPMLSKAMDKYTPIGRLAKPAYQEGMPELMHKTAERLAQKYGGRIQAA